MSGKKELIPPVEIDKKEQPEELIKAINEATLELKVEGKSINLGETKEEKEKTSGCFIYEALDQFEDKVNKIAEAEEKDRIKLKNELYELISQSKAFSFSENKDGTVSFGPINSEHVTMTRDKDNKLLSFKPENNFSGTITVDRINPNTGELIEDSKDVIFYKNGEIIGFVEGDKGDTRLKDIPGLREKGLNIPEPLIDASRSISNSVEQKLNNNGYEDLEGLSNLFEENTYSIRQSASRTANQINQQDAIQNAVENSSASVRNNASSSLPDPNANQVGMSANQINQQYMSQIFNPAVQNAIEGFNSVPVSAKKGELPKGSSNLNGLKDAAENISKNMSAIVEAVAEANNSNKSPNDLGIIGEILGRDSVKRTDNQQYSSVLTGMFNKAMEIMSGWLPFNVINQGTEVSVQPNQQLAGPHNNQTEITGQNNEQRDPSEFSVKERIEFFNKKYNVSNGTHVSPVSTPSKVSNYEDVIHK